MAFGRIHLENLKEYLPQIYHCLIKKDEEIINLCKERDTKIENMMNETSRLHLTGIKGWDPEDYNYLTDEHYTLEKWE